MFSTNKTRLWCGARIKSSCPLCLWFVRLIFPCAFLERRKRVNRCTLSLFHRRLVFKFACLLTQAAQQGDVLQSRLEEDDQSLRQLKQRHWSRGGPQQDHTSLNQGIDLFKYIQVAHACLSIALAATRCLRFFAHRLLSRWIDVNCLNRNGGV